MTAKREGPTRRTDRRRRPDGITRGAGRRDETAVARRGRTRANTAPAAGRESRAARSGPQTAGTSQVDARVAPAKSTRQAKARATARKAKAPKVVRASLRERLVLRLASIDLRPRTLIARVPFVVLIIGSLAVGLGLTLWLSTDAAERSYQLSSIRAENRTLLQQKEALQRDVLTAQSAPALAEAARSLGMIPSRDTAHLVQDPAGNWMVIGNPKPADGAPAPPLNTKLPDEQPAVPPPVAHAQPAPPQVTVPVPPGLPGPEVLVRGSELGAAPGVPHLPVTGPAAPGAAGVPRIGPGPGPAPGPAPGPVRVPTPVPVPVPTLGLAPIPAPTGSAPTPNATAGVGVEQFGPPVTAVTPGGPR